MGQLNSEKNSNNSTKRRTDGFTTAYTTLARLLRAVKSKKNAQNSFTVCLFFWYHFLLVNHYL